VVGGAVVLTRRPTFATVSRLAEPFDMTLPAISRHLKVLEKARLIERSRKAQYRPCTLSSEALHDVDQSLERYRRFFEESFDRLDDYLQRLQAKENDDDEQ
jgi:DNA-binding transcriptional ArsR family regulator